MIKAKEILNLFEDNQVLESDAGVFIKNLSRKIGSITNLETVGTHYSGGFRILSHVLFVDRIGSDEEFEKMLIEFSKYCDIKVDIPLKGLNSLCGGSFRTGGTLSNHGVKEYFGMLQAPKEFINFNISLMCKRLYSQEGVLVIAIDILSEQLINFTESFLLKLIDAIVECFIGYKKLVNQFINKPTKKTNTDW